MAQTQLSLEATPTRIMLQSVGDVIVFEKLKVANVVAVRTCFREAGRFVWLLWGNV